jgi:hypothetical protein
MSIGMGSTFVPLTLVATTGIEAEDAGPRVGPVQHLPAGGGGLGLAFLSSLAASRTSSYLSGLGHGLPPDQQAALVEGFHSRSP